MELEDHIRQYKDRLRIFLILSSFGDDYHDSNNPTFKKLFKSEVRIQKIDFLIRNPDYLAFELLNMADGVINKRSEIKSLVKGIFDNKEPAIRRLEMERFFFGAYEDIDDVIGFLKSINFIEFSSKKRSDLKTIEKHYYITETAEQKLTNMLPTLPSLKWYVDRCHLIKNYFGDLSGTQLKVSQYRIKEYRETTYNNYIGSIQQEVKDAFFKLYGEAL